MVISIIIIMASNIENSSHSNYIDDSLHSGNVEF